MFEGKTIAVVIPAYNEERLIARAVAGIPAFVDHVIVVDDASADGTAAALGAVAAIQEAGKTGKVLVAGFDDIAGTDNRIDDEFLFRRVALRRRRGRKRLVFEPGQI